MISVTKKLANFVMDAQLIENNNANVHKIVIKRVPYNTINWNYRRTLY